MNLDEFRVWTQAIRPKCVCGRWATQVAEIHNVDACADDADTPDGGMVQLVCNRCARQLRRNIEQAAAQLAHPAGRRRGNGKPLGCTTCGRPLTRPDDWLTLETL